MKAGLLLLCAVLGAGGCSPEQFYGTRLPLDTPIDWWHQLEGGVIAQDRPPPPGVNQPYPTFAKVPARPTPIGPAERRALIAQFTAARDRTVRQATQDPIVWPVPGVPQSPAAKPGPASAPPTSAPATGVAPAPAASEPAGMVFDAAPPPQPAAAPPPPPRTDRSAMAAFTVAAPVPSGPIPTLPAEAPPLPNVPGLPIDVPVPVVARPRPSTSFRFAAGSAVLPQGVAPALGELAARRAGGTVAVTAGGEARGSSLAAQRAALRLAVARTDAISAALQAAGVPRASIQAEAVAQGRDGTVRLLD